MKKKEFKMDAISPKETSKESLEKKNFKTKILFSTKGILKNNLIIL